MDEKKIKVLMVTGLVTKEHKPRVKELIRTILHSTGRFEMKITEEFSGATAKTLEDYDMVFMYYDGKEFPNEPEAKRFGEETEQALLEFVREGKGLVVFHGSVWLDPKWPDEFWKMYGGRCSYEACSRRNPVSDFVVKYVNRTHPITKDLVEQWQDVGDDFFAGIEWHPESRAVILATVYDSIEDYRIPDFPPKHHAVKVPDGKLENMRDVNQDSPVAWVNQYGRGRVFVLSIGHDMDTMRRPAFLPLFVNGCEWAATGHVTIGVPDRSGDKRLIDWPYYS